jgi:hypothetical protein
MKTVKTGSDAMFMANIYLSFQSKYCLYLLEETDINFLRIADSHTLQHVTPQYCKFLYVKVIEKPSLQIFLWKVLSHLF